MLKRSIQQVASAERQSDGRIPVYAETMSMPHTVTSTSTASECALIPYDPLFDEDDAALANMLDEVESSQSIQMVNNTFSVIEKKVPNPNAPEMPVFNNCKFEGAVTFNFIKK